MSTRCVTDSELVERARSGDAAAFGELMVRHGPAVYRAALAVLGAPAEAEDVSQEAFVQAFWKLKDFRGDASFKTWVVGIAWRRALTERRNLLRRLRQLSGLGDRSIREPLAQGSSAEQDVIASELQRDLKRLIRSLPSRLRDPFLLAATGHHSYQELAVILGVPNGTLKWRISEARRMLKEKLAKLGYSNE